MLHIIRTVNQFIRICIFQLELNSSILAVFNPHKVFRNVFFPLFHRHILNCDGIFRGSIFCSDSYQNSVCLGSVNILAAKLCGQYNRAVFERYKVFVICS